MLPWEIPHGNEARATVVLPVPGSVMARIWPLDEAMRTTAAPAASSSFVSRLFGAAALRPAVYEEVEADSRATFQAAAVVLLAALAAGVGAVGEGGLSGSALVRVLIALCSWIAWAAVSVQIGGRLLREAQTRVSLGEVLRTLGFAASPGLILAFSGLPVVGRGVVVVAWTWMLLAMIVAVRQAFDFRTTARALLVCAVGGIVALIVTVALGLLTASTAS